MASFRGESIFNGVIGNGKSNGQSFSPDTATYLQRMEDEKKARQHGATQDNRSFLAKYVSLGEKRQGTIKMKCVISVDVHRACRTLHGDFERDELGWGTAGRRVSG